MRAICLLFLLLAMPVFGAAPALPDTPAAAVAQEWIEALNSGERARLQAFKERYQRKAPVEGLLELREAFLLQALAHGFQIHAPTATTARIAMTVPTAISRRRSGRRLRLGCASASIYRP